MLLYVAITALDVRLACSDGNELVLPDRYLLKTSDDTCRKTVLEVQLSGRSLCILSRDLRQCAGHVWASVSWNAQVAYPNVRMFLSPQLTCSQQIQQTFAESSSTKDDAFSEFRLRIYLVGILADRK